MRTRMNRLVGLALASTLAVLVAGCASSTKPFELDRLAVDTQATRATDAITLKVKQEWRWSSPDPSTATDTSNHGWRITYDASGGLTVQEGMAGTLLLIPLFDDAADDKGLRELSGALKLTVSSPDVLDVQLLPKEDRLLVIVGKKIGHADVSVSVDGIPGTLVVPVDIVPQAP